MAVHPPAPADFASLTKAYAGTVLAVVDLGSSLRPGEQESATHRPRGSVADQVRQVESAEAMVLGAPVPDLDVSR